MNKNRTYDPKRRNGWARGLIHFHTRFSDGLASMQRAAKIAARLDYDFLIVTDHLRQMRLGRRKTLDEYTDACDQATKRVGIPVIPGGELEIDWKNSGDASQAHTLVLSVRPFLVAGGPSKLDPWIDENPDTVAALQTLIGQCGLPSLAAHQFQHSLARKDADFRYDVADLDRSSYVDFFYSAAVELLHEPEDITLVNKFAELGTGKLKGVFASCDFHLGPMTSPYLLRWLFWMFYYYCFVRGDAETTNNVRYADEQLSHATYVYLGEQPCCEAAVLQALRDGMTCVSRTTVEFANLWPVPSFTRRYPGPVELSLEMPDSYSDPRPRSVIVLRNGRVVHWRMYSIKDCQISFKWQDPSPVPGEHSYAVYVPSTFLSSPIVFST